MVWHWACCWVADLLCSKNVKQRQRIVNLPIQQPRHGQSVILCSQLFWRSLWRCCCIVCSCTDLCPSPALAPADFCSHVMCYVNTDMLCTLVSLVFESFALWPQVQPSACRQLAEACALMKHAAWWNATALWVKGLLRVSTCKRCRQMGCAETICKNWKVKS